MPSTSSNSRQSLTSKTCSQCGTENLATADKCYICHTSLNERPKNKNYIKSYHQELLNFGGNYLRAFKKDLQKPSAWLGVVVFALAVTLWGNYFINSNRSEVELEQPRLQTYSTIERVNNVPQGLFSYGGGAFFAPLVAQGLNDAIADAHPEFQLRYTEPMTPYSSFSEGIRMLTDGEISFAFNGRPLTAEEYATAKARGISLKQVPIALDGVVVFANSGVGVSALSLDKVRDIFAGAITNWNQLGGIDLPVVPVLLSDEELEVLDVKEATETTQYATNNTQVLRKVIGTPGAISLASASLVANQKLIAPLDLAAPHSNNFVRPFINGEPNLEAFKYGTYPLTKRQFLVIREDDTLDEWAGYAYANILISRQGQGYVQDAGSVSIY
ncbi:substrate-binding domain-containing protein [Myxosarcina sp. GI1]|uniref:substrate-binding domain-containing protein n=1 Tax=Myxosarcina sp. GI1 TaxID=1541065 RepID=UPI00068E87CE|nr:substrate-binding domain-containing protein [Myxosarcina sp. GI1]